MESTFVTIIEIIGTMAFAISGIRLASAKKFDWFGAYVVGLATAIGGGTLRDVLLALPVFWMQDSIYLVVTALSLLFVICFGKYLIRLQHTFFIFDTIGLALFVVVGIQKTLMTGYPFWVAIIMGTITGAFGGIIRDILINEEPLIFRKDIYAMACIVGGIFYWLSHTAGLNSVATQSISAFTVIVIRIMAVQYHWSLPALKAEEEYKSLSNSKDI
ncbi:MAG: trimeric intracellular cation channel family protein [Coprobacter sp.]|nr:trimeric intracellular cation channel family protein [Coprobacter sp.]